MRPTPERESDEEIVFITQRGYRWVRANDKGTWIDTLGYEFHKLLAKLGLNSHA